MRSPEAAPLVGFGATPQPFHGRPVMPNALNPAALVAGSAASLPVTLRVRRRAPKLLSPQLAHCRARWARLTSIGNDSFLGAGLFRCREISPLRRRGGGFALAPSTPSQCTPMLLDFYCCRGNRAGGRDQRAMKTDEVCDRPLETFGTATFGVVCGLVLVVAKGFLVCVCKSGAQILPHSKSRHAFAQRFFVIHKDSTLSPLTPHPCPRTLPVPSSPPPLHRRGGRSTS